MQQRCCHLPKGCRTFVCHPFGLSSMNNDTPVQENPLSHGLEPAGVPQPTSPKAEWQTPTVTEISRFEILSLGPTPGTEENFTFSDKSG